MAVSRFGQSPEAKELDAKSRKRLKEIQGIYRVRQYAWGKGSPTGDHENWDDDFVDHPSRWTHRGTGRVTFVSEPYELNDEGIKKLAKLIDEGWSVRINPGISQHFPGRTMAVLIQRRNRP